jgi:hypothetical protein
MPISRHAIIFSNFKNQPSLIGTGPACPKGLDIGGISDPDIRA